MHYIKLIILAVIFSYMWYFGHSWFNNAKTGLKIISTVVLSNQPKLVLTGCMFPQGYGTGSIAKSIGTAHVSFWDNFFSKTYATAYGPNNCSISWIKLPITIYANAISLCACVFIFRWRIWSCRSWMSWIVWYRACSTSILSVSMATRSATFSKTPLILKTVSRSHVALTIPFPCCW